MKPIRDFSFLFLIVLMATSVVAGNERGAKANEDIGPKVGTRAPQFTIRDQFNHDQTLDSLKGKNGTLLVFFRSADW